MDGEVVEIGSGARRIPERHGSPRDDVADLSRIWVVASVPET